MEFSAELTMRAKTILMSQPIQRINCIVGKIPVDYSGFRAVSGAISISRITVGVGEVPDGAEALYLAADDAFVFRTSSFGGSVADQAVIVHESVHALQDIRGACPKGIWGARAPTYTESEAAAYIVERLFCPFATPEPPPVIRTNRLSVEADRVAQQIFTSGNPNVSDDDLNSIREEVTKRPVYRRMRVTLTTPNLYDGV